MCWDGSHSSPYPHFIAKSGCSHPLFPANWTHFLPPQNSQQTIWQAINDLVIHLSFHLKVTNSPKIVDNISKTIICLMSSLACHLARQHEIKKASPECGYGKSEISIRKLLKCAISSASLTRHFTEESISRAKSKALRHLSSRWRTATLCSQDSKRTSIIKPRSWKVFISLYPCLWWIELYCQ